MQVRCFKCALLPVAFPLLTGAAVVAETYEIPRTDGEIRIDAHLDEAAWQDSLVFELDYETNPVKFTFHFTIYRFKPLGQKNFSVSCSNSPLSTKN